MFYDRPSVLTVDLVTKVIYIYLPEPMFLVFLNLEVLQNMHVSDRKKGTDLQEIQIGAILLRTKNKFETSLLPQNACLYNFHVSED